MLWRPQLKFHLLVFSDGGSDYHTLRDEIESGYAGLLDFHVAPLYPHVQELFGADKPFGVLLRPDNYIAFVSPETSLGESRAYLNGLR